jgi:hypothetical protein
MAQLLSAVVAVLFGHNAEVREEDGRAQYYSGAEWVLDADGRVIASSAVVVERALDVPNRILRQSVVRETPRAGALPRATTTTVTLLGTTAAPYSLDGLAERDGARVEFSERAAKNVLVIRETLRRADGCGAEVHILDATPLPREEYHAWLQRLDAH